jgi:drug/metabolite transporter (DMT)-like permease
MALFLLLVFISSCAQILLKKAADAKYSGFRLIVNKYAAAGYGIILAASFGAVLLYRYIELSTGALLDATSYIFVHLLGFFILKEKLSGRQLAGTALILAGVAVYTLFGR